METDPLVIVSADGHVGPRLVDDLRPLCPTGLLEAFDAYVVDPNRSTGRFVPPPPEESGDVTKALWRNRWTAGHHDPAARERDLEFDGIVAEVLFHGSQNDEPIPFQSTMLGPPADPELATAGIRIYNRWLAAYCAASPNRRVGLVQLPLWDLDATLAEIEFATANGLKGINFPAPRSWLTPYNDAHWEPLWSAAAEATLPLTTHAGAGDPAVFNGPELTALMSIESGGWFSRRAAHLLIFAGVFERHPGLRLVLTEQPGTWWRSTNTELDSVHAANSMNPWLMRRVPLRPSAYLASNVFIGASFLSRDEALDAVDGRYVDRVMWGADYPHMEGTFQYPGNDDLDGPSYARLSLRFALAGLDEPTIRSIVGETAASVYGLDLAALAEVAAAIGAPTYADISEPLDAVPAGASSFAFRTMGPWA
ncbi:MAG: amidohydrolase 2 [Ilumatobacteraceae bacterium]|nr:amidohydrolase 2 [Ilumatobacteraceae bacterium]